MATKTKSDSKGSTQKNKKIVIKRRTADLTPTKASATAIASQAARSKRQNMSEIDASEFKHAHKKSTTKIPTGIWIFFGCSLLLFCISIYKALMAPQIVSNSSINNEDSYWISSSNNDSTDLNEGNNEGNNGAIIENNGNNENNSEETAIEQVNENENTNVVVKSQNAEATIFAFFNNISNKDFDGVNNLLYGAIKTSSEIREHFSEFRMNPFIDGIVGNKITPANIEHVSTSAAGNETYKFNLSYTLQADNQQFDEERTITTKNVENEWKVVSIKCETYRCSFHPIFWPEKFGLM